MKFSDDTPYKWWISLLIRWKCNTSILHYIASERTKKRAEQRRGQRRTMVFGRVVLRSFNATFAPKRNLKVLQDPTASGATPSAVNETPSNSHFQFSSVLRCTPGLLPAYFTCSLCGYFVSPWRGTNSVLFYPLNGRVHPVHKLVVL